MLIFVGLLLGAVLGVMAARRRGGDAADMAQYAAAYGIGFAIIGLALTLILGWSGVG